MKLFIWADPFPVWYGCSLLVVAAESVEDARREAVRGTSWAYGKHHSETPSCPENIELGEPTRVIEVPCAEWHQWGE